jgi:hypothetical protein
MTNTKLLFQIRDKLAATLGVAAPAFDSTNFTEAELKILFQSQLLGSKFCSEEFTQGATEYLRENQTRFEREILIHDLNKIRVKKDLELFDQIWADVEGKNRENPEYNAMYNAVGIIRTSIRDENQSKKFLELLKFSSLSSYDTQIIYAFSFLSLIIWGVNGTTDDFESFLKLIPEGEKSLLGQMAEGIGNLSWEFDELKFRTIPELDPQKKAFFLNMLREAENLKVLGTIISALFDERVDAIIPAAAAAAAPEVAAAAGSGSESLTAKQRVKKVEEALESEFPRALREEIDRKLAGKLDVAKFKSLAKEYKMPTNVVRKLLDNSDAIFLTESNSGKKIAEYFPELTRQSEYVYKFPKKFFDRDKTTELVLHSYDDPTALFVGKMTKSCQFFTGASSDQAVIPVYSKPGCSLVSVRKTGGNKQIFASMFAWLGTDAEGSTGLVLDSIELSGEERIKYTPNLLREFSQILRDRGLKLWVGSGGQTPELSEPEAASAAASAASAAAADAPKAVGKKLEIIPQPTPINQDFKPYGDAAAVYEIDPRKTYKAGKKSSSEERSVIGTLLSSDLPFAVKRDVASICAKFPDDELWIAINLVIGAHKAGVDLVEYARRLEGFSDEFIRKAGANVIDSAIKKGVDPDTIYSICAKFPEDKLWIARTLVERAQDGADLEEYARRLEGFPEVVIRTFDVNFLEWIIKNKVDPATISSICAKFPEDKMWAAIYLVKRAREDGDDLAEYARMLEGFSDEFIRKAGADIIYSAIKLRDVDPATISSICAKFPDDESWLAVELVKRAHESGADLEVLATKIKDIPCDAFYIKLGLRILPIYTEAETVMRFIASDRFDVEDAKSYFEDNPGNHITTYLFEKGVIQSRIYITGEEFRISSKPAEAQAVAAEEAAPDAVEAPAVEDGPQAPEAPEVAQVEDPAPAAAAAEEAAQAPAPAQAEAAALEVGAVGVVDQHEDFFA